MIVKVGLKHGDQRCRFRCFTVEEVYMQRKSGRISNQPDNDLGVDTTLVTHPNFAQVVFFRCFKIQGCHIIEHHRYLAMGAHIPMTLCRNDLLVATLVTPLETVVDGVFMNRCHTK